MSDSIFSVNRENISTELQARTTLSWSNIWLLPHEATQRTLSIWPTDISGNWSCAHLMTCFPSPCSDRSTRENTNRTNRSDLLLNILQLLWTNWEKHWWLQTIKLRKRNPKCQTDDTLRAMGATRGSKTRPRLQSCARENNILLLDRTCVEVSGPLDLFTRPQH